MLKAIAILAACLFVVWDVQQNQQHAKDIAAIKDQLDIQPAPAPDPETGKLRELIDKVLNRVTSLEEAKKHDHGPITPEVNPGQVAARQDRLTAIEKAKAAPQTCPAPYEDKELRNRIIALEDAANKKAAEEQSPNGGGKQLPHDNIVASEPPPGLAPKPGEALHWTTDLAAAEKQARELNRPVFIDFETSNCDFCRKVKSQVYERPEVSARLRKEFVPVWLYCPSQTEDTKRFSIDRFPTAVVILPEGRSVAFVPASDSATFLDQLDMAMK